MDIRAPGCQGHVALVKALHDVTCCCLPSGFNNYMSSFVATCSCSTVQAAAGVPHPWNSRPRSLRFFAGSQGLVSLGGLVGSKPLRHEVCSGRLPGLIDFA